MSMSNTSSKSEVIVDYLASSLALSSDESKQELIDRVSGIFEFVVSSHLKKVNIYTLDLKEKGCIVRGRLPNSAPDVILSVCDGDFIDLAEGRLHGQRAFMLGKLKMKGKVNLAVKLDTVFKQLLAARKSKI